MEAERVTLTDDEVRDRFSALFERDVPADELAFIEKRFAEEPSLRGEFDTFKAMMGDLARISLESDTSMPTDSLAPVTKSAAVTETPAAQLPKARTTKPGDILSGVQQRLYVRSRGKFYRNQLARSTGGWGIQIAFAIVLLVLVVIYLGLTRIVAQPARDNTPTVPAQ